MDTFCGSLCGCGVVPTINSRSGIKKDTVISAHRYAEPAQDPDEDDDIESDEELSLSDQVRRVAS